MSLSPLLPLDICEIVQCTAAAIECCEWLVDEVSRRSVDEWRAALRDVEYDEHDVMLSVLENMRRENVLDDDRRKLVRQWREYEEWLNQYDGGPWVPFRERLRQSIDLIIAENPPLVLTSTVHT